MTVGGPIVPHADKDVVPTAAGKTRRNDTSKKPISPGLIHAHEPIIITARAAGPGRDFPMNAIRPLTQDHLDALLRDGEFPESVRLAAPQVVVVMTQDWCGQWASMKAYLPDFAVQAAIFAVEYNLLPDFQRIMRFKEDVWGNQYVPYVRFYRAGKLVRQSNWVPRASFAAILGRE